MLLSIKNLSLSISQTNVLSNVSFSISPGEILGLVGESGSGKSLTALTIMQLLPNGSKTNGKAIFNKKNLLKASEDQMCALRGDDIGMVFQEPMTALNPVKTIGDQIIEGICFHTASSKKHARFRAREILAQVGLPASIVTLDRYPHELSGGQRQRVVIAIACAINPKLLIADEPTTALDVTVQAQILKLLKELVIQNNMGLLLISHDLGLIAEFADNIIIMRAGEIVERGDTKEVLRTRSHPYTRQLAKASTHKPIRRTPPITAKSARKSNTQPLLQVKNLICEYSTKRHSLFEKPKPFRAINDISFSIFPGQTLGLVGESGCGKSTLARTLLRVHEPLSGEINFEANDLINAEPNQILAARRHMQIIFQDPYGSFNPRQKVRKIVAEPAHLLPEKIALETLVSSLEQVGLKADDLEKYPHEFSGGQRQRLAIARALITNPKLIIADEPVSALDVSIRAHVLDLLSELRDKFNIAYLFITHDLGVVKAFCDDVMVMKEGKILEQNSVNELFDNPKSDYTTTLLRSAPAVESLLQTTS